MIPIQAATRQWEWSWLTLSTGRTDSASNSVMISKLFFCFTILCLSSVTLANTACIVGAGPAGLTVAKGLEDRGYTTVLFDKNAQVGGKCQSYYDEQCVYLNCLYAVMPWNNFQRNFSPHGCAILRKWDIPADSADYRGLWCLVSAIFVRYPHGFIPQRWRKSAVPC